MRQIVYATILATLSVLPGSALAAGDIASGEKLFRRCAACHTAAEGAANKIGPNLFDVFGSTAGERPTKFKYSPGLAESGIVWDEENLDKWLTRPRSLVAKTRMAFPGFKKANERADVIAYLKTLTK